MFRKFLVTSIPWSVPALVAAGFGAVEVLSKYAPSVVLSLVPWIAAAVTAVSAFGAYAVARPRGRGEAAALATTAFLLAPTSFACFLITDVPYGRLGFAVAAIALLSFYLAYLRGIVRNDSRFTGEDFSHLSFAIHVMSAFFAWYAMAALPEYLPFPLAAAAAVVTLLAFVIASETLRRAGLPTRRALVGGGAMALLASQMFAALAFLPTSDVANAAVGTVLFAAGLHASVAHTAAPVPPSPVPLRRQLAFSCLLVAIVLSTARWA